MVVKPGKLQSHMIPSRAGCSSDYVSTRGQLLHFGRQYFDAAIGFGDDAGGFDVITGITQESLGWF